MKNLFVLFAIALLPLTMQAQKLEGMKDALKSGSSGGGGRGGESGGRGGNSNSIWGDLILNIVFEPTWWLLYGFPGERPANYVGFNDYPYADDRSGIYLPPDYEPAKRMNLQLVGHLQTDQDAVFGGFLQAKWSPNRALSLDVNHLQLFEAIDDIKEGKSTDHFAITNFNLAYNRVHHSRFQLWWGGGLMLVNGGGNEVLYGSPSVNLGFEWFIKRPISLHADTQIGAPNGVYARQNQVRVQMHLKRFMVYAGYQGVKVGNVGLPSVAVGSGVWF